MMDDDDDEIVMARTKTTGSIIEYLARGQRNKEGDYLFVVQETSRR